MKVITKIIFGLGTIFLGIGVLLLLGLPALGIKSLTVQTGSMSPNISVNSVVFVRSVPTSSLKIGDVITYASSRKPGETITHRVIQKYKVNGRIPGFVTKGDANKVPDSPIVGGQVKGKVLYSIPYLGGFSKLLRSWPAIIVLIYLPAFLLIIDELKRLSSYYRSRMPYVLAGYHPRQIEKSFKSIKPAIAVFIVFMSMALVFAMPAYAQFNTNTVSIINNRITIVPVTPPPVTPPTNTTTCNNTNNVNVNNTVNQTANSGDVTNNNNQSTGSSSSGNASNSNNTNVNIGVTNRC